MAERYRSVILGALDLLSVIELEFTELTKAHREQLRPDLLFRHALPFCVTEETYFRLEASSSPALAALFAGHTLALTHLDYHLDGSSPDPNATATAVKMDPAVAAAYSVRMIYVAGRIWDKECPSGRLFLDVLDPVSGFVVARMHQDRCQRYSIAPLRAPREELREYLGSSHSRLQGSGYWEVMVRGSFSRHRSHPPEAVLNSVRILRALRQVVDEIADFDDDLRAGLVTTPLLFGLNNITAPAKRRRLEEAVRALWQNSRTLPAPASDGHLLDCRELVMAAGGFDSAFEHAHRTWQRGVSRCARTVGPNASGYLTLLDLKRAKLEELAGAGWRDNGTDQFFA